MFAVQFTARAERDVREAARWWRANRAKAPNALEEELHEALELLSRNPRIGTVARNAKLAGIRRICLNRVGYYIYYRVRAETQTVEVGALWHVRRGSLPRM